MSIVALLVGIALATAGTLLAGCDLSAFSEKEPTPVVDHQATMGDPDESTPDPPSPSPPPATPTPSQGTTPPDEDVGSSTPEPFLDCSEDSRQFWTLDTSVDPPVSKATDATCRLTGKYAYLYVTEDEWETSVNETSAQAFLDAFDRRAASEAAYDLALGIFELERNVYGEPPNTFDDDDRIYLLLMDIPDLISDSGAVTQFEGFFNPEDQLPDDVLQLSSLGLRRSNELEILYINARLRPITEERTLAVTARELQQMILFNYDSTEEPWVKSALGEGAALLNGFVTTEGDISAYLMETSVPLVSRLDDDYTGAYVLWGAYLIEQLGLDFLAQLEAESQDGVNGMNRALQDTNVADDFQDIFGQWIAANALQDVTVSAGQYGYSFSETLPDVLPVMVMSGPGGSYDGSLVPFAVDYIHLSSINSDRILSVTTTDVASILIRIVKWGPEGASVEVVRPTPQGQIRVSLAGGWEWDYMVAVSNVDTTQVDTGEVLTYSLTVGE